MRATENQVPLDNQFSTELFQFELEEGLAKLPAWLAWEICRLDLERIFFFLICSGRDAVRLHFFTRRRFIEIRGAQGISDINERAFLVPNFEIVTLKSEQHSLPSCRYVTETIVKKSRPRNCGLFPRGQHHVQKYTSQISRKRTQWRRALYQFERSRFSLGKGFRCKAYWLL